MRNWLTWLLVVVVCLPGTGRAAEGPAAKPVITFRVRVTRLKPEQPATVAWRYGGEGMGGQAIGGLVTEEVPLPPNLAAVDATAPLGAEDRALGEQVEAAMQEPGPQDRVIVPGNTTDITYLFPGAWSKERPITMFGGHRGNLSVTFGVVGKDSNVYVSHTELEFEFHYGEQLLRRFVVNGAEGNALGVMIPYHRIKPDGSPAPEFAQEVGPLFDYVQRKLAALKLAPGMDRPVPKLYAISTDCYGFGGGGYSIRTSDPATFLGEFEILRLLGMNGTVNVPAFFSKERAQKQGVAAHFSRLQQGGYSGGYQIPTVQLAWIAGGEKRPNPQPGDGCPFYPATLKMLNETVAKRVEESLAGVRALGVDEVWARTVDEIGSVFDGAPEGKAHQGACPYCREAFREFIRADGRTLADFGAPSWDDIRSTYGYWTTSFAESLEITAANLRKAEEKLEAARQSLVDRSGGDLKAMTGDNEATDDLLQKATGGGDAAAAATAGLLAAKQRWEAVKWSGAMLETEPAKRQQRLSPEGWNLLWYYSARFNCEASARCFTPLRQAYEAVNARKREALARGETDTPAATQPWIYFFALRGNTFLMSGHSLDFFNFYRHADTAFVYETSNRDWRVWQWDGYLCDVGRSLSRFMGKQFGIYLKPHRGAPIQRALTAAAHGARMIYWYTYGPEYVKGDSFGGNVAILKDIAQASRLLAGGEAVTYDADWAVPAEVAVVRPLTSEYMSGSASYENAKWVRTALMHAHLPMDALDEGLLLSLDLAPYKVIVISGSHLRRDVAQKLAQWVAAGGTLVTSGWGMARDEAGRPLELLWPVFGVKTRGAMDAWGSVPGYGATRLGAVHQQREPPAGAAVTGKGPLRGGFRPVVGREVLDPAPDAEVMATYADGGAAVVRHRHGKGTAWLIGLYAGVEYAWECMTNRDDDQKSFSADKRSWIAGPALEAGARPIVDAQSGPTGSPWSDPFFVEGYLLRNRQSGALAAMLINWGGNLNQPVTVSIREGGAATKVQSVALGQEFPLERRDDRLVVTLPRLGAGEVLLLKP